jgi:uncharacterized protein with FMN-binding domain
MMRTKEKWSKRRRESLFGIITLFFLVLFAVVGFNRSELDISVYHNELWPEASNYESIGYESQKVMNESGEPIGSISSGTKDGFGGPLKVLVALDSQGMIQQVQIVEHRETPSWYDRVLGQDFMSVFIGKGYTDPIQLDEDIDAITGATYTTRAITMATKEATLAAAEEIWGLDIAPFVHEKRVKFGLPEISLLMLLLVASVGMYRIPQRHKKTMKWILMILSAILIGFVFNHPLTLVDINKLIMGYWPDMYNQIYWYILIFGIVLVFLTTGRNTYCKYICPFGAVQECVGAIGGAKALHSRTFTRIFQWTRKLVVLLAIMLALIYRNPGMSSYEVYGTLFNLLGTNFELFFLLFVLSFALFIKRPWCNYLCPIPVIEQFARLFYNKTRTIIKPIWINKMKPGIVKLSK